MPKKALLAPTRMREVALRYRDAGGGPRPAGGRGALRAAAGLHRASCARSWDSEAARLYRRELHIADEWGTAVIVQSDGVREPRRRSRAPGSSSPGIPSTSSDSREPYGDFVVQGQGDDVVGGPRRDPPHHRAPAPARGRALAASRSRSDFPAIYGDARRDGAHPRAGPRDEPPGDRVHLRERPARGPLHPADPRHGRRPGALVPAFEPTPELDARPDRGRASASAAGRSAAGWRTPPATSPSCADAIPADDDHPAAPRHRPRRHPARCSHVDGLLTALGGATSHAAVAAKRLGKTCVVGCRRPRRRRARDGRSRIGGHELATGRPALDQRHGRLGLPRRAPDRRGRACAGAPSSERPPTRKDGHERHRTTGRRWGSTVSAASAS